MLQKTLTDEELDELLIEYMPKANILLDKLEENRDKDMPVHVFSKQHQKKMEKIIKKYSRTHIQRKFVAVCKYAAVFFVALILINSVLVVTVQAYREKFIEVITNVYKEFTSIVTEVDEKDKDVELKFLEPSYIPEGFKIINYMQTDVTRKIDYANGDRIVVFKQSVITNGELRIDTEDVEIKQIEIDNYVINYAFNKGMYNAYWHDDEFRYIITAEIPFNEMLKIIEGIIQKQKK